MTLAIDFDRTIHDMDHPVEGRRMGPPMPGTEEALETLAGAGHAIIVHTTRARTEQGADVVAEWLDYYDLPYADITATKPDADYYIDDKALHHNNWANTLAMVGVSDDD